MALTSFPNGVQSFGMPVLGSGAVNTTGNVFFVDSGSGQNGSGRGLSPGDPASTIDWTIGQCTANNGDVIFVMPGHVETVNAASALDLDVAGVRVIGLGWGDSRPQINFTTTTAATVEAAAASCSIENCLFTSNIDALVVGINVTASDFSLVNCEFRDVTGQAVAFIAASATGDRLTIDGLFYNGAVAAGGAKAIGLVGCDAPTIKNSIIRGNFSVGAIDCLTTAVTNLRVHDCIIDNRNSGDIAVVDTITASTGLIGPNVHISVADDAANLTEAVTGATFRVFDQGVTVVNADNQKSLAIAWTASADS